MEDDSFFFKHSPTGLHSFLSLSSLSLLFHPSLWQWIRHKPSGLRQNCKAAVFLCHFDVFFLFFWLTHLARGSLGRQVDVSLSLEVRPSAQSFLNCCQFTADCQIVPCVRRMLPLGLHLEGMHGWKRFSMCDAVHVWAYPLCSSVVLSFIPLFFVLIPLLQGIWSTLIHSSHPAQTALNWATWDQSQQAGESYEAALHLFLFRTLYKTPATGVQYNNEKHWGTAQNWTFQRATLSTPILSPNWAS